MSRELVGLLARGFLIVAVGILGAAAAFAFSESQERQYTATTQLGYGRLLSPELQVLGADFNEPDVDEDVRIATEAERLESFDVAVATATAEPQLDLTAGEIAGLTDAEPQRGTLVLALTAKSSSPQLAADLADGYARQYLRRIRSREQRRALLIEQVLQTRLRRLDEEVRAGPIGAALRNQVSAVNVLQEVGSGSPQIVERARASGLPVQPQTTRNVLFGLLFGLAVGIGLVALRSEGRARTAFSGARDAMSIQRKPIREK